MCASSHLWTVPRVMTFLGKFWQKIGNPPPKWWSEISNFFDGNPNWMAPLRIDTWPKCCPLTDLRLPPLQHLGHLSLQIYLLHDPVLRIALTYLPMVSQKHYWIILLAYSPPDLLMIRTCNKITTVLNYNITWLGILATAVILKELTQNISWHHVGQLGDSLTTIRGPFL